MRGWQVFSGSGAQNRHIGRMCLFDSQRYDCSVKFLHQLCAVRQLAINYQLAIGTASAQRGLLALLWKVVDQAIGLKGFGFPCNLVPCKS